MRNCTGVGNYIVISGAREAFVLKSLHFLFISNPRWFQDIRVDILHFETTANEIERQRSVGSVKFSCRVLMKNFVNNNLDSVRTKTLFECC